MPPGHSIIGSQWHIGAICQVLALAGNGFSIRQIYPVLTTSTAHAQVFGKAYCTNRLTSPPAPPLAPLQSACHISAQEILSICEVTLHHSSAQQPQIVLIYSVKAKVLMVYKLLYVLLPLLLPRLTLNLTPLPWVCFPPATGGSSLCLQHLRHTSSSGPLHLVLPLWTKEKLSGGNISTDWEKAVCSLFSACEIQEEM